MEVSKNLRLPGVEPGSIAWKAIILTVGLQTLDVLQPRFIFSRNIIVTYIAYLENKCRSRTLTVETYPPKMLGKLQYN